MNIARGARKADSGERCPREKQVLAEIAGDIVRVAQGPHYAPWKGPHLILADKAALLIAFIVAAAMAYFWTLGMVGLWGSPLLRFDHVMIGWTLEAELVFVLPIWLFLRIMDIAVAATNRHWQADRYAVGRQTVRHAASTEA
jgi:hypothetical protein